MLMVRLKAWTPELLPDWPFHFGYMITSQTVPDDKWRAAVRVVAAREAVICSSQRPTMYAIAGMTQGPEDERDDLRQFEKGQKSRGVAYRERNHKARAERRREGKKKREREKNQVASRCK